MNSPVTKCKIFLSYRRDDAEEEARRLFELLKGQMVEMPEVGQVPLDIFFDVETLGAVAKWQEHLRPALEGAHTLIVLISYGVAGDTATDTEPDWLHEELRWWLTHRPGIDPILVDTTGRGIRWLPRFARTQWKNVNHVPFKLSELDALPEQTKVAQLRTLIDGILTGIKDRSGLIHYEDVERLQKLTEGLERLTKRLKYALLGIGLAFLFVAILLLLTNEARKKEVRAKALAQEALTRNFVRTIGISDQHLTPRDELASLWELAELDSANSNVRKMVLDSWFGSAELLERALKRDGRGLKAVIGISPSLSEYQSSLAGAAAKRIAAELVLQGNANDWRLNTMGRVIPNLVFLITPDDAKATSNLLSEALQVLQGSKQTNTIGFGAIQQTLQQFASQDKRIKIKEAIRFRPNRSEIIREDDPLKPRRTFEEVKRYRLSKPASAVTSVGAEVKPGATAQELVIGFERETNLVVLSRLVMSLAACVSQLDSKEAAAIAQSLTTAFQNPQEVSVSRLSDLSDALMLVTMQLDSKDALATSQRLLEFLDNPKETNSARRYQMRTALPALAAKTESSEAKTMAALLVASVVRSCEADGEHSRDLIPALSAMMPEIGREGAAEAARHLAKALASQPGPHPRGLRSFTVIISMLANRMTSDDAAATAQILVEGVRNPAQTNQYRLNVLVDPLVTLANQISPAQAAQFSLTLIEAIEDRSNDQDDHRAWLVNALTAFAPHLDSKHAEEIGKRAAGVLAEVLGSSTEKGRLTFPMTVSAMASLATKMRAYDSGPVSRLFIGALETPLSLHDDRLSTLARGLANIAQSADSTRSTRLLALDTVMVAAAVTRLTGAWDGGWDDQLDDEAFSLVTGLCRVLNVDDLAKVLKWPLCVGQVEQIVLWELEKKTNRKFDGDVNRFIEQAEFLHVGNLDAPAKRPRTEDALKELEAFRTIATNSP